MKNVWISPLAGTWYQNSKMALEYDLESLCRNISAVRKKTVCAAVVPHAAYRFSGRTAAGVFLRIDPRAYARIVILAPSHYAELHNQISTLAATHILTPLGELAVDAEWLRRFRDLPFAVSVPSAHAHEHSDQIQLPLIQHCLSKRLPVACLICGRLDADQLLKMADALRRLLDDRTLVIVSSDFTHFGARFGDLPSPGSEPDAQQTNGALDAFELFASCDLQGFLKHLKRLGHTLCVRDPLPLLMALMPEGAKISRTGGVIPNGSSYAGALVEGRWSLPVAVTRDAARTCEPLTSEEGAQLIEYASAAVRRAFRTGIKHPIWGVPEMRLPPRLRTVRGGFVTLFRKGHRQGCMGEIFPHRPIWQVVVEQTLNAAFHDARVAPVSPEDWPAYSIEVEVLSEPYPVADWRSIRLKEKGILLRKGAHYSFFLPGNPIMSGRTLEQILEQLALKAGLPADGWQNGASFLVFQSQRFEGAAVKK